MTQIESYSNTIVGSIQDISMSEIVPSTKQLRVSIESLDELTSSITRIGLLQPVVVRIADSCFEIVAGNRRYFACKKLGIRKIPCHVVELDDKEAFEFSLVENVQRCTLNPLEEANAFRKYVERYGWGGTSDLAHILSKSVSYITKRIKLLDLPQDVIEMIAEKKIYASSAEELMPIKDKKVQSELATKILKNRISSKRVRSLVKDIYDNSFENIRSESTFNGEQTTKSFDKTIIVLKLGTRSLARIIEDCEENWFLCNLLMQHKNLLDHQIDLLINQKRKWAKKRLVNFLN